MKKFFTFLTVAMLFSMPAFATQPLNMVAYLVPIHHNDIGTDQRTINFSLLDYDAGGEFGPYEYNYTQACPSDAFNHIFCTWQEAVENYTPDALADSIANLENSFPGEFETGQVYLVDFNTQTFLEPFQDSINFLSSGKQAHDAALDDLSTLSGISSDMLGLLGQPNTAAVKSAMALGMSDVSGLSTALSGKFANPTGTTSQYLRGDGTLATTPTGFTDEAAEDAVGGILNSDFVYNDGANTITARAKSFTNNASHSIVTGTGATGFQVSSTRDAEVNYSVTITTTATIGGASSGTVVLEVATTNSATAGDWQEVGRCTNGQAITLALALQSVQTIGCQIGAIIPAGNYAKLRSINNSGTPSYSYNSGQEVLY